MARETLLTCDRCGRKQGGRIIVFAIEARRSDGTRWMVDLCRACADEMGKEFGWSPLQRVPRKTFTVYDSVEQIPTNGV